MFQWICLKHAGTPWHPIKMCHGWRPRIHLLKRWQALPQASGSRGLTVSNLTPESSPLSPISGLSDPFFGEAGWNSLKFRMLTSWIFHDFPKPMEGKFIFRIHFMQCDAVPVFLCFSSLGEGWLFYSLLLREQATLPTVQTVTVLKALQALQGLVANTRNTARCIMLHYCASCRHVVMSSLIFVWLLSWIRGCSSTLIPTRLIWWKVWGNYSTFAARCTAKNRATK